MPHIQGESPQSEAIRLCRRRPNKGAIRSCCSFCNSFFCCVLTLSASTDIKQPKRHKVYNELVTTKGNLPGIEVATKENLNHKQIKMSVLSEAGSMEKREPFLRTPLEVVEVT